MASSIVTIFSSFLGSVIDHIDAMIRESFTSLAIKASIILLGAMTIVIAVAFVMFGAVNGLSKALSVDLWLGYLITGVAVLLPILLSFMFISLMARRRSSKKKALQKEAAEALSRKASEIVDVSKWVQEYPFYSTGAAAAAGFAASGVMTPGTEAPSPEHHSANIQDPIIAMLLVLAEDVLKDAVVPFVKEHLTTKPR